MSFWTDKTVMITGASSGSEKVWRWRSRRVARGSGWWRGDRNCLMKLSLLFRDALLPLRRMFVTRMG